MSIRQISATELKARIQNEEEQLAEHPFLLDVREPHEFRYVSIENSLLIPLNQIPQRLGELNPQQEIIVICHHGVRSQQACMFLVNSGFERVANLTGGIDAWACECDPSMPRY